MIAAHHVGKLGKSTLLLSLLIVQVACYHGPQTGGPQASVDLPHFDRVHLLEETLEASANVGIGDMNGDGQLDIVLAKGRHSPLVNRILFGDGRGGFPSLGLAVIDVRTSDCMRCSTCVGRIRFSARAEN